MPIGALKNYAYRAALPLLGKHCARPSVACEAPTDASDCHCLTLEALRPILKRHHVVGTAIQIIRRGGLAERYLAGLAQLTPSPIPVQASTIFRGASIAKLATALLVFRLQTLGLLDVSEDISAFLSYPVRNPLHVNAPISLGMLLSHTSSIVDSSAYFAAFSKGTPLHALLQEPSTFSPAAPGMLFRYSNLAAGMIGCALEARFGRSFEALAKEYLFAPLEAVGSFDITSLPTAQLADSYRVLPSHKPPSFDAVQRKRSAAPIANPSPEQHYLLASGSLFVTAEGMGKLLLPLMACVPGDRAAFLDERSLLQMKTPLGQWPEKRICMRHGMGLLELDDRKISRQVLYGHQGFAYGAVNGCFLNANGDGFVSLNSGASEARSGHLSDLNRNLISMFLS